MSKGQIPVRATKTELSLRPSLCDLLCIFPVLVWRFLSWPPVLRGRITLTAFGLLADIAPRVEDAVMEGRRQPERQSMEKYVTWKING